MQVGREREGAGGEGQLVAECGTAWGGDEGSAGPICSPPPACGQTYGCAMSDDAPRKLVLKNKLCPSSEDAPAKKAKGEIDGGKGQEDDGVMGPPPPKPGDKTLGGVATATVPCAQASALVPIFGECVDDELSSVRLLISDHCATEDVEIEIRLGRIVDKNTCDRIKPNWAKSSFIVEDSSVRFDARVNEQSFYKINQDLNKMVESPSPGRRLGYTKIRHLDLFYPHNQQQEARLTLDAKGKHVVACVTKQTLQQVDVYRPRQDLDIRYRAAVEKKLPAPEGVDFAASAPPKEFLQSVTVVRSKERRSYSIDSFRVDLTTVTEYRPPAGGFDSLDFSACQQPAGTRLEIEVEIDVKPFKTERTRAAAGHLDAREKFTTLCRMFVENARGIASAASSVRDATLPSGLKSTTFRLGGSRKEGQDEPQTTAGKPSA
ncbi:mRNA-capping enzyme subunit beta [Diplonema papillatum]|nr:mRNA-capping enzyme subunit beta [Diplonema papillatum]